MKKLINYIKERAKRIRLPRLFWVVILLILLSIPVHIWLGQYLVAGSSALWLYIGWLSLTLKEKCDIQKRLIETRDKLIANQKGIIANQKELTELYKALAAEYEKKIEKLAKAASKKKAEKKQTKKTANA